MSHRAASKGRSRAAAEDFTRYGYHWNGHAPAEPVFSTCPASERVQRSVTRTAGSSVARGSRTRHQDREVLRHRRLLLAVRQLHVPVAPVLLAPVLPTAALIRVGE